MSVRMTTDPLLSKECRELLDEIGWPDFGDCALWRQSGTFILSIFRGPNVNVKCAVLPAGANACLIAEWLRAKLAEREVWVEPIGGRLWGIYRHPGIQLDAGFDSDHAALLAVARAVLKGEDNG